MTMFSLFDSSCLRSYCLLAHQGGLELHCFCSRIAAALGRIRRRKSPILICLDTAPQPHMIDSQFGLRNLRVIRSDSPIASYLAWSKFGSAGCPAGALRRVGGNVQTPKGWSLVSLGFALISDFASRTNPTLRASSMT